MNKKKLISCFVTYFITTTFSLLFFDKGILAEPLDFASDAVLASVDGRAITIYDLNNTDRRINVRNINEFKNRPEAKNALELLILQQLLLSEAERFKISASDNEIEQAVNEMATQNNLSPEQFLKKVGSQGLDPDSLKEQIKIEVIKSKLSTKLLPPTVTS